MTEWLTKVLASPVVVEVRAETVRSLEEGTGPVGRIGVIYEAGENKKTGLPFVRMLVTHERDEDSNKITELDEPKFRTIASESALGLWHRRWGHLEPKDPSDYMKGKK